MARKHPEITGESAKPRIKYAPGAPQGSGYRSSREDELKLNIPKQEKPFDEDKHLMSREPFVDYSFIFVRWVATEDYPSCTEWSEVDGEIEFRVQVRTFGGPIRASVRMPVLETKAGKDEYTKEVRRRLLAELKGQGMETK